MDSGDGRKKRRKHASIFGGKRIAVALPSRIIPNKKQKKLRNITDKELRD